MNIKQSLYNITQESIVYLVMFFVFLPVRLLFASQISDDWLGSFGVISAIVVTLVILSKKNKLGIFGRMYWKTISRLHRGKRRIISYFSIAFMLYFWGATIFGIQFAETNQDVIDMRIDLTESITPDEQEQLDSLEKAVENKDIQQTQKQLSDQYKKIPPEILLIGIIAIFFMPIIDMVIWSVLASTVNDWLDGWFLHFGIVFFVESLEVAGIMIYTYIQTRNTDKQP